MGWGNCGTDSTGRKIGYAVRAKCDHRGCKERIDRGLSYACGEMHGAGNFSRPSDRTFHAQDCTCELYFCSKHLHICDDGIARCSVCTADFYEYSYEALKDEHETLLRSLSTDLSLT